MKFAPGIDQQQLAVLRLTVVVAIMQDAGVGAGCHDRRIRDRLRAEAQEFVHQLRLDFVFVPARAREAHCTPVCSAGDLRRPAQQRELLRILVQPHRGQRGADVDHRFRRGNAGAHAIAYFIERRGDRIVPQRIEPERRVERRPVARPIGELASKLRDGICLVEAEDLPRSVGTVAKAVPYLTLGIFVAAEQNLTGITLARAGGQDHDRLRLRKTGQIVKIAVRAVRIMRVGVAYGFRRRRNRRNAAACLLLHIGD